MKKIIDNKNKKIIFNAPPSKSISIRAIAIAMAAVKFNPNINNFAITNFSNCKDSLTALNIAKQLGSVVDYSTPNTISLLYDSLNNSIVIDCEESALCYRLFSSFTKLFPSEIKIVASEKLEKRVANDKKIIETTKGNYEIDCSSTSQQLTGLLYTLPFAEHNSTIKISNLVSKKYVDLSIDLLKKVGIDTDYSDDIISIVGNQKVSNNFLLVEGDWSSASYFFVLGAIAGDVLISGLNAESKQPDAIILKLFEELGIDFSMIERGVFAVNKSEYNGFEFDITDCPDLATSLVVLGFNAKTPSKITGIHRLTNKESNRRDVLLKVFSMLGGKIRIVDDSFEIQPSKLTGGFADSHNDHRIAMSIGIASKLCRNPITLTGGEYVNKSFPDFWKYIC
jgi:3-phosphoshikimate 1-carboxyvinyltransferase